jgi:hypothetical protein
MDRHRHTCLRPILVVASPAAAWEDQSWEVGYRTRRRAAIAETFTEDCVFYDPREGVYRGSDEIDRIAGAIRSTHPDFRYQPIAEPEELANGGRVQWVSGRPGDAPAYAGTDSSLPGTAELSPFISFSTSYHELWANGSGRTSLRGRNERAYARTGQDLRDLGTRVCI